MDGNISCFYHGFLPLGAGHVVDKFLDVACRLAMCDQEKFSRDRIAVRCDVSTGRDDNTA